MSGNTCQANRKLKRTALCGAALALTVTLSLLTGVVFFFAGNTGLFEREMARFAPPEKTGLPETEYPAMAAHIADYLTGGKDSFQFTFSDEKGNTFVCFHDDELVHMADCRGLIQLDRTVCLGCAALAVLAGIMAFRFGKQGMEDVRRGAKRMLWALSLAASGMVLWAVLDFDGLFVTFHRLAFRNDLWLLDPRTDLLIRLMPQELFVDLGLRGLALFAAGELLLALPVLACGLRPRKKTR